MTVDVPLELPPELDPPPEPESGVGLTAPPPPPSPQAAKIKGNVIAVKALSSLLYVLKGDLNFNYKKIFY